MSIPKVIHYCWFGGNPLSKMTLKCIESWKKYCPDYEIIEWNESNFDISCTEYTLQMSQQKKWAFLSDYARLKIIYENGGIYLDTDVELIKPLDRILEKGSFMALQHDNLVATGLGFAAEKGHPFLKKNMAYYEELKDFSSLKSCPIVTTDLISANGFEIRGDVIQKTQGLFLYPQEYFCPKNERTGILKKTRNTVSIHHFDASWFEESWKEGQKKRWKTERRRYFLQTPNRILIKVLGEKNYSKLKKLLKRER